MASTQMGRTRGMGTIADQLQETARPRPAAAGDPQNLLKLQSVPGVSNEDAQILHNHGCKAELFAAAERRGISAGQIIEICQKYGPQAIQVIQEVIQLLEGVQSAVGTGG